jgi:hypothetical protein
MLRTEEQLVPCTIYGNTTGYHTYMKNPVNFLLEARFAHGMAANFFLLKIVFHARSLTLLL